MTDLDIAKLRGVAEAARLSQTGSPVGPISSGLMSVGVYDPRPLVSVRVDELLTLLDRLEAAERDAKIALADWRHMQRERDEAIEFRKATERERDEARAEGQRQYDQNVEQIVRIAELERERDEAISDVAQELYAASIEARLVADKRIDRLVAELREARPFVRSAIHRRTHRRRPGGEDMSEAYWSVIVSVNDEPVVTIESNCLSGRELSEADKAAVRMAAHHLLGFIGDPVPAAPSPPPKTKQACKENLANDPFR